jgi:hypothetical protein
MLPYGAASLAHFMHKAAYLTLRQPDAIRRERDDLIADVPEAFRRYLSFRHVRQRSAAADTAVLGRLLAQSLDADTTG